MVGTFIKKLVNVTATFKSWFLDLLVSRTIQRTVVSDMWTFDESHNPI
jgi:hypothetical protein